VLAPLAKGFESWTCKGILDKGGKNQIILHVLVSRRNNAFIRIFSIMDMWWWSFSFFSFIFSFFLGLSGRWLYNWVCQKAWLQEMVSYSKVLIRSHRQAMPREVGAVVFQRLIKKNFIIVELSWSVKAAACFILICICFNNLVYMHFVLWSISVKRIWS
jgi:hypothetical protein